jgi:hypothetical protein
MRRMRSLRLLQTPPKCVAQFGGAVCVVPTAVREDDALGLPGQYRLDSRLQFVPVPPRDSRRSRDTPPYGGAMPPNDFSNHRNKRLTFGGS